MSLSRIRPWQVVTILCLVYVLVFVFVKHGGDALALVDIGTQFSAGVPAEQGGTEGYDGQFGYYIARDPSNAAPYLDVSAYRFQRILLPIAGRVLAFGQDAGIPWALLVVNLVALAIGTALMEYLLVQYKVSRWYALSYGLTLGTFGAVRLSLPEPLAYALVLGGIFSIEHKHWIGGAVLMALAALAKETALVFVAGYALYWLVNRNWRPLIFFSAIAVIPFVAWQLVLYNKLGAFGVGSGGKLATSFEIIPFAGFLRILTEAGVGPFLVLGAIIAPFALVPTVWGLRQCWREYRARESKDELIARAYVYLLLSNALIMLFVPFSTYREPLGILRFIVGLQIAVLLYAAERRNLRVLLNSTIWVVTLLFIVVSDFGGKG